MYEQKILTLFLSRQRQIFTPFLSCEQKIFTLFMCKQKMLTFQDCVTFYAYSISGSLPRHDTGLRSVSYEQLWNYLTLTSKEFLGRIFSHIWAYLGIWHMAYGHAIWGMSGVQALSRMYLASLWRLDQNFNAVPKVMAQTKLYGFSPL
jgi:hypothetical protein